MLDNFLKTRFIVTLLILRFVISYLILPQLVADGNLSSHPLGVPLNLLSTGLLVAALILALLGLGKSKGND